MSKKCVECNKEKNDLIRVNSMETYMQFQIKKKLKKDLVGSFVCLDCRELFKKELEEESGIEID